MTETVDIYINSANRISNYDAENFQINLGNFSVKTIKAISVRSITIPQTYYNIRSTNNKLVWTSNSVETTTTIAVGNYSTSELVSTLENALNSDKDAGDTNTYSISLNAVTEKLTISGDSVNFDLNFSDANSTIYKVLGYTQTDKTGAQTYTASYIPNLRQDLNYIFIESDLPLKHPFTVAGVNRRNYIAYMSTSNFGDISSLEDAQYVREVSAKQFSTLNFRLVDEVGNQVSLNGYDWSMIITFILDN